MIPDQGVTTPIDRPTDSSADRVDREATLNTEQAEADQIRRDNPNKHLREAVTRNIMVRRMMTFFNSFAYLAPQGLTTLKQTMIFVRTHLANNDVPDKPVDSFDNADYDRDSDDDDVQTVSVPESVLEAFTDDDLLEYEKLYNKLVNRLLVTFQGYSIEECRVIVQAYCMFKGFPLMGRQSAAAVALLATTREVTASGSSGDAPGPLDKLAEFDGGADFDVGQIMADTVCADHHSQADLFKEKRALGLNRLKANWVKDPSFRDFHADLLAWSETCPKVRDHLHHCLSREEYQEAIQPSKKLVFHDPTHSSKYMKSTHVLPQENWIPEDLAPTEEEITIANKELEAFSNEHLSRATALLSSDILPHGDHEYQVTEPCYLCNVPPREKNKAYACIVCQACICFACRNKHMPKFEGGLEVVLNLHPVQCDCSMADFRMALLKERKRASFSKDGNLQKNPSHPSENYQWVDPGSMKLFPHQEPMDETELSHEEQVTHGCVPLGAILFSRAFSTVQGNPRTALDFNGEPTSLMPDFERLAGNGQADLPDEDEGNEATAEEMKAITVPVRRASYGDYRAAARTLFYGATAPGTAEQIRLKSHFERCSHHVQQILNMNLDGAPEEILNLLHMDSHSGLLQETDHHWSERADLEKKRKRQSGEYCAPHGLYRSETGNYGVQ